MLARVLITAGMIWTVCAGSPAIASLFVTDLVDGANPLPIDGNQAWPGQLGDDFTVNASFISITSIGVFDDDGDGTFSDLVWQLFNVQTGVLIHQEVVAASGARLPGSAIEDNYIWETLAVPLLLPGGATYSAVAYGFNSTDENFNTNFDLANLDVVFNTAGLTGAGGRYSSPVFNPLVLPQNGAGNSASVQPYNFGAASF